MSTDSGKPLARYAACRRFGDYLFCSGVTAVDPTTGVIPSRFDQLPLAVSDQFRSLGYNTGQFSVDTYEAPIVVQSWLTLERIRTLIEPFGGQMSQVARLVQYFRDLRDYPEYNRVRDLFFTEPVVSTVVEISRVLPSDSVLIEVEATIYCPRNSV